MDYPNKREYQDRAASGEPVSQDEVSYLEREEGDMTGSGPIAGGTAGMSNITLLYRKILRISAYTAQRRRRACTTGR